MGELQVQRDAAVYKAMSQNVNMFTHFSLLHITSTPSPWLLFSSAGIRDYPRSCTSMCSLVGMDVGSGGSKWNWTISRLIWKRDHFFGQELHTTLLIGFSRQSAKPFRRKFSDNLCNKTEHCRWKEGATNQIVLKFSPIHRRINLKA